MAHVVSGNLSETMVWHRGREEGACSHLDFLKLLAGAEDLGVQVVHCGLHRGPGG